MMKISELKPPIKCVPITGNNYRSATEKIEYSKEKGADAIELRADFLDKPKVVLELYKVCSLPTIITCRRLDDGGRFEYPENKRLELLRRAATLTTTDLEFKYVPRSMIREIRREYKDSEIIISRHYFDRTPERSEIIPLVRNMEGYGDIVKVVPTLNNMGDYIKWEIWTNEMKKILNKPFISFAMGKRENADLSKLSRVMTFEFGGTLSFFSIESGKESAPGQIPIDEADYELSKVNIGI